MQPPSQNRKPRWSRRKIIIVVALTALALTFLNTIVPVLTVIYLAQPVKVEGVAMSPTFNNGDRIFINKRIGELKRGDIIAFWYPEDTEKSFLKRIVGLPGEKIRIDENGRVYIDGYQLDEPYVQPEKNLSKVARAEQIIKQGHYFVMGDNRDASNDSRRFGTVSRDLIYGKFIWRYWSAGE